jgi:hypothetical protein
MELIVLFKVWITCMIVSVFAIVIEEGLRPDRYPRLKMPWAYFCATIVTLDVVLLFVLCVLGVWL